MTTCRFLSYVCYSMACPAGMNPGMWAAMLSQFRRDASLGNVAMPDDEELTSQQILDKLRARSARRSKSQQFRLRIQKENR